MTIKSIQFILKLKLQFIKSHFQNKISKNKQAKKECIVYPVQMPAQILRGNRLKWLYILRENLLNIFIWFIKILKLLRPYLLKVCLVFTAFLSPSCKKWFNSRLNTACYFIRTIHMQSNRFFKSDKMIKHHPADDFKWITIFACDFIYKLLVLPMLSH